MGHFSTLRACSAIGLHAVPFKLLQTSPTLCPLQTIVSRDAEGKDLTFVQHCTNQMFTAERVLLYTLNFDLNVHTPFKWLSNAFSEHLYSAGELREQGWGKPDAAPSFPDTPLDRSRRGRCRMTTNCLAALRCCGAWWGCGLWQGVRPQGVRWQG